MVGSDQKSDDILFLTIDGPMVRKMANRYHIQGFPTIYYVRPGTKGHNATEFDGDRHYDDVLQWIENNIQRSNLQKQKKIEATQECPDKKNTQQDEIPSAFTEAEMPTTVQGHVQQMTQSMDHIEKRFEKQEKAQEDRDNDDGVFIYKIGRKVKTQTELIKQKELDR